jgi:hypothetical protein
MRVDLDERKIDFEMAEKTISAPIGRKKRGAETAAPAAKEKAEAAQRKPLVVVLPKKSCRSLSPKRRRGEKRRAAQKP